MAPSYEYFYSTILLKKFYLKEKQDYIKLQYMIESDLRFLVNTSPETSRFKKILKLIAENIYGYIRFNQASYIYEKSLESLIKDYDGRLSVVINIIEDSVLCFKNNI